jgi:hypothetical protein
MAQLWSAVLRAGDGAALSHITAAELDELTGKQNSVTHVTIDGSRRVTISGGENPDLPRIVVHRSARISQALHPTRTPPRTRIEETVLDLTQTAETLGEATDWLTRACSRRLTTQQLLRNAMTERAKLRWRGELTEALEDISEGIHSRLEWRYVHDVERPHGLPRAIRQARNRSGSQSRYLDNEYRRYGLVVELDGRAAHPVEARWLDIRRDNASAAADLATLRYGWADVTALRCRTAGEIAAVLQLRGWPGRLRPCEPHCAAVRRNSA